eukprot:UN14838
MWDFDHYAYVALADSAVMLILGMIIGALCCAPICCSKIRKISRKRERSRRKPGNRTTRSCTIKAICKCWRTEKKSLRI